LARWQPEKKSQKRIKTTQRVTNVVVAKLRSKITQQIQAQTSYILCLYKFISNAAGRSIYWCHVSGDRWWFTSIIPSHHLCVLFVRFYCVGPCHAVRKMCEFLPCWLLLGDHHSLFLPCRNAPVCDKVHSPPSLHSSTYVRTYVLVARRRRNSAAPPYQLLRVSSPWQAHRWAS
jgi:hypothetical protein